MDRKRPHPDGVHEGDRKRRVSPSESGGGSRASSSKARARAAMMPGDEEDGEMDSLSLKVEVSTLLSSLVYLSFWGAEHESDGRKGEGGKEKEEHSSPSPTNASRRDRFSTSLEK